MGTHHPDTGNAITGQTIPDMPAIRNLCEQAHKKMLPGVPLAGWDVALTPNGLCLLETNLSCNFFRGQFDYGLYFQFMDQQFSSLCVLKEREDNSKRKLSTHL